MGKKSFIFFKLHHFFFSVLVMMIDLHCYDSHLGLDSQGTTITITVIWWRITARYYLDVVTSFYKKSVDLALLFPTWIEKIKNKFLYRILVKSLFVSCTVLLLSYVGSMPPRLNWLRLFYHSEQGLVPVLVITKSRSKSPQCQKNVHTLDHPQLDSCYIWGGAECRNFTFQCCILCRHHSLNIFSI